MTREDIIAMALEAGFAISTSHGNEYGKLMPISDSESMVRFANLVAAHEREECAKVCMSLCSVIEEPHEFERCAEAIRARRVK